jgi:S1-C subfamily serine protease
VVSLALALGGGCGSGGSRPADGRAAAVQVTADGCPDIDTHGGGTMVAAGRVLTAAHVVAGATSVTVTRAARSSPAMVVVLDPIHDLAVLAVDPSIAPVAPIDRANAGDRGIVMVVRAGVVATLDVQIRRLITLQTEDIYLDGTHDRDAVELDADIEPGDSGASVLVRGRAVAVVFARDRQVPHTGFGLDPQPIVEHLADVATVPTGACARVG